MNTPTRRVYVPRDSAAVSVGADAVCAALQLAAAARGMAIDIVRTGSRGLYWLEPLIEVDTPAGRVGFGPLTPDDVDGLVAGDLAAEHPRCIGLVEQLPYLARQERLTFARCGVVDPVSVADYRAHGGFEGLRAALDMTADGIVEQVTASGLRGRGGAAFPAGIKWRTVATTAADQKYVCCNADEGDSGTFADRMLMEGDPLCLVEGMTIAGIAVGATIGYVYVRSEYPDAIRTLQEALAAARGAGWLGDDIQGSGRSFDIVVRRGAGAYICGEETAMLESLEGRRGMVRFKPPLPAISGLFGCPTLINNVLTLAAVPLILARGADFYAGFGQGRSRGTQAFQLAGNIRHGGLVEKAFGVTLRELVEDFGGGTASGRPLRAVQAGGPLGAYLPADRLDLAADYEVLREAGAMLGHGGLVVFDDTVDMRAQARFAMAFCEAESCGKCTPCRIGATRGKELIDRIDGGPEQAGRIALLRELCELMEKGSMCAMGGMTPYPVLSALDHFPEDFTGPEHTDRPGEMPASGEVAA
jgi:formate dehydrogenase iron-sulfur subunit